MVGITATRKPANISANANVAGGAAVQAATSGNRTKITINVPHGVTECVTLKARFALHDFTILHLYSSSYICSSLSIVLYAWLTE